MGAHTDGQDLITTLTIRFPDLLKEADEPGVPVVLVEVYGRAFATDLD